MFSKSCEYGLQAVLYIAQHTNDTKPIGLKEIAEAQNIPVHFLSKVLQTLVKKKILNSSRGLYGGFYLKRDADTINLMEIINAIDGMDLFNTCVLGLNECSEFKPCPIHDQYKPIKERFMKILTNKSVRSLADEVSFGKTFLSNNSED